MNTAVIVGAIRTGWKHRRGIILSVFVLGIALWLSLLMLIAIFAALGTNRDSSPPDGSKFVWCGTIEQSSVGSISREQADNAFAIVQTGVKLGIPTRGLVVAIATALQESGLRNLDYGDRDSLGLFQQRPSTGWGTPQQVRDPELSAKAFFGEATHTTNPGLLDVPGWQDMTITQAAQAVQRSAFPDYYAKWENAARSIVEQVADVDADCDERATGGGGWVAPLQAKYPASSRFGSRIDPLTGLRSTHHGHDIAAPAGTTVQCVHSGKVTFAGYHPIYGNFVLVDHGGGVVSGYAHLSTIRVNVGQSVATSHTLGDVGSTGKSTGDHLHFEIRIDGVAIDPTTWIRQKNVIL